MQPEQTRSLWWDSRPTREEILSAWERPDLWLSRKAICDYLGRSKSPTLIAQIEALVVRGLLVSSSVKLPNGVDMLVYGLASHQDAQQMPN